MIAFVCHPYHRGGVTSWMIDLFNYSNSVNQKLSFVTVFPKVEFISGKNRPTVFSLLKGGQDVYFENVGHEFELGVFEYRVEIYKQIIQKSILEGSVLIPSDDEACWVACVALANKYPVIGVLHSDDIYYYGLFEKYYQYLSACVSVSNRTLEKIPNRNRVVCHKVIPCGIPIKINGNSFKKNQIVWIGRMEEEQKRVSDIIPILLSLNQSFTDWKCILIGDGSKINSLKEYSKKNKLDDKIEFLGWVSREKVFEYLQDSKIVLQTSNYEGMSLAVMEGMAAGCMIVSSKVSGTEDLPDLLSNNRLVRIFPVGDIEKASQEINNVFLKYQPEWSDEAANFAFNHFSLEVCLKKYLELSEEVEKSNSAYVFSTLDKFKRYLSCFIFVLRKLKIKLTS